MTRRKNEYRNAEIAPEKEGKNPVGTAIGMELRSFRQKLGLTVHELATKVGLSGGSLSKIENGLVLPSIPTVFALAGALHIPVTALFRKFDQERDVTFVRAGEGLKIERRGTRAGHQYQLLGHTVGKKDIAVEPYMCTLTEESEVYPIFQHPGIEFLYMLEGEMNYRHGGRDFKMTPGDSMFFDSDVPHGPEDLLQVPIRFLAIIVYSRASD
ncbi:MAG: helix-turn-helix transcriptional regulator [Deltaproteobacteria bacterium]|nr:helix-turn-helix transcriptional regulator [Deltaproteobacteria bacterium]